MSFYTWLNILENVWCVCLIGIFQVSIIFCFCSVAGCSEQSWFATCGYLLCGSSRLHWHWWCSSLQGTGKWKLWGKNLKIENCNFMECSVWVWKLDCTLRKGQKLKSFENKVLRKSEGENMGWWWLMNILMILQALWQTGYFLISWTTAVLSRWTLLYELVTIYKKCFDSLFKIYKSMNMSIFMLLRQSYNSSVTKKVAMEWMMVISC